MSVALLADTDEFLRPGIWVDHLDAFIAALDSTDAPDALAYCEQAWDIWDSAVVTDLLPESHPAMLIVLGVRHALSSVMASTFRGSAEAKDRVTVTVVRTALIEELSAVRAECDRWRDEGLPSAAEVRARSAIAATGLHGAAKRPA